jgi:hypothetical protein
MTDQSRNIDEAEFEAQHLRKLLQQACVEIAEWKIKAQALEKEVKLLQQQLDSINNPQVVRVPFGVPPK